MPLLLPVLVRGINNLSDARYCAGMGADGLIFTLDPSLSGAVDAATVKELAGWVSGVELIGEFGNMPATEVNRLVAECGLNRVFLNLKLSDPWPTEPLSVAALVKIPQMVAADGTFNPETVTKLRPLLPAGFEFVILTPTDQPSTVELYTAAARMYPLWLSGSVDQAWAQKLAIEVQPAGLILNGGDEIKPGLRDFTELEAIFEALEE